MEGWEEMQRRHKRELGAYIALKAIQGGGIRWAAYDMGIDDNTAYRRLRDAGLKPLEVTRAAKAKGKGGGDLMERITYTLERSHPDYMAKVARFMGIYHPPSPDAGKPYGQEAAE